MHQVSLALKRVKCFVAALILGITALIGIALSAASLVKEVHTACHIDQLSKNVSVALIIQEQIEGWRIDSMLLKRLYFLFKQVH